MIKYSFNVDDKDEVMNILVQQTMVDVANELGLVLTISYKKFGEPRTGPKGLKVGIIDPTLPRVDVMDKGEKKERIKASIKDWRHKIR